MYGVFEWSVSSNSRLRVRSRSIWIDLGAISARSRRAPAVARGEVALAQEDDDGLRLADALFERADVGERVDVEPHAHAGEQQLQLAHERVHLVLARAPHVRYEGVVAAATRERELGLRAGRAEAQRRLRRHRARLPHDGDERDEQHDERCKHE